MEPKSILSAVGAVIVPKLTGFIDSKYSIQFVMPSLNVPKLKPINESKSVTSCPLIRASMLFTWSVLTPVIALLFAFKVPFRVGLDSLASLLSITTCLTLLPSTPNAVVVPPDPVNLNKSFDVIAGTVPASAVNWIETVPAVLIIIWLSSVCNDMLFPAVRFLNFKLKPSFSLKTPAVAPVSANWLDAVVCSGLRASSSRSCCLLW